MSEIIDEIIIDVRERDEFEAEHIETSINLPLSTLPARAQEVMSQAQGQTIVLMCRSGKRANIAAIHFQNARIFEGGILEWKRQGRPTRSTKKRHFPILRQVHLVAGTTILTTAALGALMHPGFLWVTAFFGAGLTVSGATGFCGMAEILSRMPWNQVQSQSKEESCRTPFHTNTK